MPAPRASFAHRGTALGVHAAVAVLRDGETVRLRSIGGSMWPAIRSGATLEIRPCTPRELRPGRIYAYLSLDNRHIITHRLESIEEDGLVFWGDARREPDPKVALSDVLGAVRVVTQGGIGLRMPRHSDVARVETWLRALRRMMSARWPAR